jgi:hypothetical protein
MVSLSFISTIYLSMMNGLPTSSPLSGAKYHRTPTIRKTELSIDTPSSSSVSSLQQSLSSRAAAMKTRAQQNEPLTTDERLTILHGIQNLWPNNVTFPAKQLDVLLDAAHAIHKDWAVTNNNSKHADCLLQEQFLTRILDQGNWEPAVQHAFKSRPPWAVLVTGTNGIRKTTALYESWFPRLLREALVRPPQTDAHNRNEPTINDESELLLPSGHNAFFRQLDHMIATICNEEFGLLYKQTAELTQLLDARNSTTGTTISSSNNNKDIVKHYTDLKGAIFARYRTLSELLGVALLREAQRWNMNCMLETSGRDVAMFHYVDYFFPSGYNKLALHFQINDLELAKESVDQRMIREIQTGAKAVALSDAFEIVYANAGGPYGSEALLDIQTDSDHVWHNLILNPETDIGNDWFKATIQINAHPTEPWTAQAVKPDGTLGTTFLFGPTSR